MSAFTVDLVTREATPWTTWDASSDPRAVAHHDPPSVLTAALVKRPVQVLDRGERHALEGW
jgi:hypothetical protein